MCHNPYLRSELDEANRRDIHDSCKLIARMCLFSLFHVIALTLDQIGFPLYLRECGFKLIYQLQLLVCAFIQFSSRNLKLQVEERHNRRLLSACCNDITTCFLQKSVKSKFVQLSRKMALMNGVKKIPPDQDAQNICSSFVCQILICFLLATFL